MKRNVLKVWNVVLSLGAMTLLLASCSSKEQANIEADILKVQVSGVKLIREAVITNDAVTMVAAPGENVTAVVPTFILSEGATITPANGAAQDFTNPVIYTVTAEDKVTQKKYTVSINVLPKEKPEEKIVTYSFEDIRLQKDTYQVFLIKGENGAPDSEWGSSNLGYALTGMAKTPEDYPATQAADGYKGKCLKLTTKDTGEAGKMFGAPLAAGSLFLGVLDAKNIATDPLKATQFGIPVTQVPTKLTGYYKYTAGKKYMENGKEAADTKDHFDIYGIFYEVTPDVPMLDGTNAKTSPNIVLMAQIESTAEPTEWTALEIPFKEMNGKKVDAKKLAEGKYNFSIIISSSANGASYSGAVESTLLMDEMSVHYTAM